MPYSVNMSQKFKHCVCKFHEEGSSKDLRVICTEDMKRAGLLREHNRLEENDAFSDRVSVVLETRRFQSFGVGFFLMWCSFRVRCEIGPKCLL